jgi:hypothetical protein
VSSSAQLKFPVTNNDLRNNLGKVVADFPNHLSNIISGVKAENPQTVEYASNLEFKGAEENTVTKYNGAKPIYSWQAVLLTTEEFEDASKKYKWLCNQLKAMTLNVNGYSFSLEGKYDAPSESKKFSGSIYHLSPASIAHPKVRVEAGMQYFFPEWRVTLTVYDKEREDSERGNTDEK